MKKAIKKTCVVLLLFALLVSQVAASYSETGTLNEGTSAISAAERYLSNWAYNSYMYADKNLTLGTVLDAEVEPAKLTLATSEIMALRNDADGQENNISVAVSKMQANIQFMIDKATYFSTIRQYNGLQRTDFNTDYVVQRVDVQGNFAVIEVLENISFQYVGAEDSSFSQKEHTVSLIKVDGEWIVANVETKYDWFANEYKDTEYKELRTEMLPRLHSVVSIMQRLPVQQQASHDLQNHCLSRFLLNIPLRNRVRPDLPDLHRYRLTDIYI